MKANLRHLQSAMQDGSFATIGFRQAIHVIQDRRQVQYGITAKLR